MTSLKPTLTIIKIFQNSLLIDFAAFQQDEVVGEAPQLPISRAFDLEVVLNALVALQDKPLELRFFVNWQLGAGCPVGIFV